MSAQSHPLRPSKPRFFSGAFVFGQAQREISTIGFKRAGTIVAMGRKSVRVPSGNAWKPY